MYKLCVFAGTTEGRQLIDLLAGQDVSVLACVATEYGGALLDPREGLAVSAKRMTADEMAELFERERFDLVIDATHPYASAVTENIMLACGRTDTQYLRLERGGEAAPEGVVTVPDIASAVEYLNDTEGSILLTTGSKELLSFASVRGFAERTYARVLPMEASLAACREAGLEPAHIIAMQGPFSQEMNAAMIKAVQAAYVVTKASGKAGGFEEKAAAALEAGARLLVIGRPQSAAAGLTFAETVAELERRFGIKTVPSVAVAGVGPGERAHLTAAAHASLANAQCVIGAERMLALARPDQTAFKATAPEAIVKFINEHKEFSRFAVLMSGDVGFFSGAKKLLPLLKSRSDNFHVEVYPGISSLAYLSAKLGTSYEDVKLVSLHGRDGGIVPFAARHRRVFAIVGGENGAGKLICELSAHGLGHVRVAVGERLGYPDERIIRGSADELKGIGFDPLSCLLIENESPISSASGLPDAAFIRNAEEKPVVPMTKSEVRAVIMSKLRLLDDSVCWDIGSGTGSVAVEMALCSPAGRVYAIEKKPEAAALINDNAAAFGIKNIGVIEGSAPEVCEPLPFPTHAFIGGSSGNMREIITLLLEKNPSVRIVAAAIALETAAELNACIKEFGFTETEVVSVSVAKAKKAGPYSLMTGQNPVYVFTMQRI